MKLDKLSTILAFFSITGAFGQNNSYPTTGDVKIFAGGSSWGEGLAIVKPSGWSGIRMTRNDPASGNYNGNWALGYNVATGNDFSISTNNGGIQYDGLFHISNTNRNVGIGTTTPTQKLDVNGNINMAGIAGRRLFMGGVGGTTFGVAYDANNPNYGIFYTESSPDYISLSPNGVANNGVMNIYGDGKVGIGTTTPDATLAVKGQIHAQEVKVDLNGAVAPDYVFATNYQLPTLDYIKTYIDRNKHLPEVPSAQEMETNGVNLGEMNMLLLKKIEELTLYVIELNKRDEAQQIEIEQLKTKE